VSVTAVTGTLFVHDIDNTLQHPFVLVIEPRSELGVRGRHDSRHMDLDPLLHFNNRLWTVRRLYETKSAIRDLVRNFAANNQPQNAEFRCFFYLSIQSLYQRLWCQNVFCEWTQLLKLILPSTCLSYRTRFVIETWLFCLSSHHQIYLEIIRCQRTEHQRLAHRLAYRRLATGNTL